MPCCAKKPSLPSPLYQCLYVRRNNGKAHRLNTAYALLNQIHRKLVKTRNLLRNTDPSIPYKIGYKPENFEGPVGILYTDRPLTCAIVDIFILKNFHYISFVLYRVSCVRNFLAYKLWFAVAVVFLQNLGPL